MLTAILTNIVKPLITNIIEKISFNKLKEIFTSNTIKYSILCEQINSILYENHNLYVKNCPLLNLDTNGQIEIENWYQIEEMMINQNNLKILDLIDENNTIVPFNTKELFLNMKQHIISFDKHIKNREMDYSKNQFPREFVVHINQVAERRYQKDINKIIIWLKNRIQKRNLSITKFYIFGSVLLSTFKNIEDVDIILYTNTSAEPIIANITIFNQGLLKNFKKQFKKNIHIQVFSNSEENDMHKFISKLYSYKEIEI